MKSLYIKGYFPLFEKHFADSEFNNHDEMRQKWYEEAMQRAKGWYKTCYNKDYGSAEPNDTE